MHTPKETLFHLLGETKNHLQRSGLSMLSTDPLHSDRYVCHASVPRFPLSQHINELLRGVGRDGGIIHDELVEGS